MDKSSSQIGNTPVFPWVEENDAVHFRPRSAASLRDDEDAWAIIEANFPPQARDARETTLDLLAHPDVGCITAASGGRTVGLVTTAQLRAPDVLFVGYVAVAAHARGRRVGERLLDEALRRARARLAGEGRALAGIVCEVERVHDGLPAAERAVRAARYRFFERCGGRLVTDAFLMPPHEGHAPTLQALFFLPDPAAPHVAAPSADALARALVEQHYRGHKGVVLAPTA